MTGTAGTRRGYPGNGARRGCAGGGGGSGAGPARRGTGRDDKMASTAAGKQRIPKVAKVAGRRLGTG